MSVLITPAILRAYGTGLPITTFADADLAGAIDQAEGDIFSYMNFREDNSLGFAPGSHTERHPWNRVSRRVYPASLPKPVTSITSYVVVVGQNITGLVQANVDPGLVIINNDLGYLECTSLAVVAFGLTPVVAQITVIEPYVLITYQAAYSISKVNFRLLAAADLRTYHSFRPGWDLTQAPVVSVNGSVVLASTYTVNGDDGLIVFNAAPQQGSVVRATFTHTIPDTVTAAARLATVDVLEETFVMRAGLAGFGGVKSGVRSVNRRIRPVEEKKEWQRMLDTYRQGTVRLASTRP